MNGDGFRNFAVMSGPEQLGLGPVPFSISTFQDPDFIQCINIQ